ncbi:MAG: sulfurtransferase [Candidatus Puniceispirillum sp. TMED52]|nr:sulfurtransferase [SAR116 cluster bacterium]OUU54764.1 MAG: sulfurtransferase [Candidatus Puniceispirillum sp. TMED52]
MKPLKRPVKTMVAEARNRITEYTAAEAMDLHNKDDVVIVDIRDIRERQKLGFIPGSFHAPRGMLEFWVDPESPYFKDVFGQDKRFVLHCASGWRSALSAATLQDMGFEAAHIDSGFNGWVEAGGSVEKPEPSR